MEIQLSKDQLHVLLSVLERLKEVDINEPPDTYSISVARDQDFYLFKSTQDDLKNPDLVNMLFTHVSIINSQRNAIWQRFAAMVTANTITLGFFSGVQSIKQDPPHTLILFVGVFGLALCVHWFFLMHISWRHYLHRLNVTSRFMWRQYPPSPWYPELTKFQQIAQFFGLRRPEVRREINPIWPVRRRSWYFDWMRAWTYSMIFLFSISYWVLLRYHLRDTDISIKRALSLFLEVLWPFS